MNIKGFGKFGLLAVFGVSALLSRTADAKQVTLLNVSYDPTRELYEEVNKAFAAEMKRFPIIPCTLCGSQDNLQRKQIGEMLREWERRSPGRVESMLRALTEVRPSHLLDRKLFDFTNMK